MHIEEAGKEKAIVGEFSGKVVLITGAGRGLGRDLALGFSSLGARVAANDINPISLDETVELVHEAGGKASTYVFDIAKRMPIEALIAQVIENYGRIDVLVNHASVEPDESLLEMDEWEFHRTLDVNLGGPFFTMQQVGRVMRQQGEGSIINLISTTGKRDYHTSRPAYTASQSALIGLTQAAASELSTHHIRVNAVCDGPLVMGQAPTPAWDFSSFRRWRDTIPDLILVDRANLVKLVLFICSSASSPLTGQVLTLSSGT